MNGAPSTPTANMPTPPVAFSVSAPPFGNCSETTPNIVGQKKVFPTPYNVAAAKIISPADFERHISPAAANAEQTASSPSGDNLCTRSAAKNRNTSMMADV